MLLTLCLLVWLVGVWLTLGALAALFGKGLSQLPLWQAAIRLGFALGWPVTVPLGWMALHAHEFFGR